MDLFGLAAVIGSLGTLIASAFAGYIALKQMPQIHNAVNSASTLLKDDNRAILAEMKAERDALLHDNRELREIALAKAEGQLASAVVATPGKSVGEPSTHAAGEAVAGNE